MKTNTVYKSMQGHALHPSETRQIRESSSSLVAQGMVQQRRQLQFDDFQLAFYQKTLSQTVDIPVQLDRPYLQMHFEISGGSTCYEPKCDSGIRIDTASGKFALFYLPKLNGQLRDPACQQAFSLEIEISQSWIEQHLVGASPVAQRFLQSIQAGEAAVLGGGSHPISPALRQIIFEIYHCSYSGAVKRLFIEGQLLQMLGLQLYQAQDLDRGEFTASSHRELEKLHKVKERLSSAYAENHKLDDLAHLAQMNRTKLQAEFKQRFGCTLHEYVVEARLSQAKLLLTADAPQRLSIAAVAKQVGYKTYTHFSSAFKKRYGTSPSAYRLGK